MKYKNIIWDLDGTLLDTLQDLADATNYALRTNGMEERTLEEIRQFVGNGVRNLIIRAVPQGEDNPSFETVFQTFKEYYIHHCQDSTKLYPGIKDTLQTLKERGIRMAIVSNKLQRGVTELYDFWFKDYIDVAVGEREGVARKPAPDMVRIAMEELGIESISIDGDKNMNEKDCDNNCEKSTSLSSDTVYIGDSDVDIATARNSHLPCISVLWGFRDRDFLINHGATTFISTPQEILNYV